MHAERASVHILTGRQAERGHTGEIGQRAEIGLVVVALAMGKGGLGGGGQQQGIGMGERLMDRVMSGARARVAAPRAAPKELSEHRLTKAQIDDVATAVQRALDVSTEEDVVLIAGSLYVAGAARTALESPRT